MRAKDLEIWLSSNGEEQNSVENISVWHTALRIVKTTLYGDTKPYNRQSNFIFPNQVQFSGVKRYVPSPSKRRKHRKFRICKIRLRPKYNDHSQNRRKKLFNTGNNKSYIFPVHLNYCATVLYIFNPTKMCSQNCKTKQWEFIEINMF